MLTGDPSIDNYRGGRHLDAIALNDRLQGVQKAVMFAIASQMNVRGDFREERWIYVSTLIRRSGFKRSAVLKATGELTERGYLAKRPQKKQGDRLPVLYQLTDKIFAEFQADNSIRLMKRFDAEIAEQFHPAMAPVIMR